MLIALFILILGLTPSLFSIWVVRQADSRVQTRLRLAVESMPARGLSSFRLEPDQHYIEGIGYIIGDLTCRYNARSSYVRCAVNPFGPCTDCSHYESKAFQDELQPLNENYFQQGP